MALSCTGQLEDWLRFARIGIAAGKGLVLLRRFGSPTGLFAASDADISSCSVGTATAERIRAFARADVRADLDIIHRLDIKAFGFDDDGYPARLKTINDPPALVFIRGSVDASGNTGVALVGTRRASTYGRLVAERVAADLARHGVTVVSGLARGIDTAAHEGALRVGGCTIGICGCGVDVPYPRENKTLIDRISSGIGSIISEFAVGTYPEAWHFPARNRIISGLALGVLVVEAPENSGALITADFAAEQGRDVFAVPGNVDSGRFKGCHRLIKEGAGLVETVDDILDALNIVAQPRLFDPPKTQRLQMSPTENRVLRALELVPRHIDDVSRQAELTAAQASATLLQLEIKGLVRKLPGGMFVRSP